MCQHSSSSMASYCFFFQIQSFLSFPFSIVFFFWLGVLFDDELWHIPHNFVCGNLIPMQVIVFIISSQTMRLMCISTKYVVHHFSIEPFIQQSTTFISSTFFFFFCSLQLFEMRYFIGGLLFISLIRFPLVVFNKNHNFDIFFPFAVWNFKLSETHLVSYSRSLSLHHQWWFTIELHWKVVLWNWERHYANELLKCCTIHFDGTHIHTKSGWKNFAFIRGHTFRCLRLIK